jgi:hypothetical protein
LEIETEIGIVRQTVAPGLPGDGFMTFLRKVFLVLALVALADPALAMGGGRNKGAAPSDADKSAAAKKAKETEKAYQEALKKIPDSTKKQDPWGNMR